MSTLIRSGDLALPDVARAMSYDGWIIDSVDLRCIRAHRRVNQLVETAGMESWFNDGYLTIERADGRDLISFRPCFARVVAMNVLGTSAFLWIGRSLGFVALFLALFSVAGGIYQYFRRKPVERAAQLAMASSEWDFL